MRWDMNFSFDVNVKVRHTGAQRAGSGSRNAVSPHA